MTEMKLREWARRLGLMAVVAAMVLSGVPAMGEVTDLENLDPSRVRWSELDYRAKKLGFSANTAIQLEAVSAAEAAGELLTVSEGRPKSPGGDGVTLMKMETGGLGQDSLTRLWVNPADATALQRDQHDRGKRKRWRAYRYGEEGVASVTYRPETGEEEKSPESWSNRASGLFEYPEWLGDGALITEPAAILFIASAAALDDAGDRIQIPTFSKNQLVLVELRVEGMDRLKVNYSERSSSGERQVKGTVDAIRILVDSRALGPDSDEDDFEFLGLSGDVEMWLDQATRVPLQVSGRVPVVGRANVRLQRAVID